MAIPPDAAAGRGHHGHSRHAVWVDLEKHHSQSFRHSRFGLLANVCLFLSGQPVFQFERRRRTFFPEPFLYSHALDMVFPGIGQ